MKRVINVGYSRISLNMMKKITLSIPDDLDELFRRYIETEYRGIKGAMSIVGIKAIEKYLEQEGYNSVE